MSQCDGSFEHSPQMFRVGNKGTFFISFLFIFQKICIVPYVKHINMYKSNRYKLIVSLFVVKPHVIYTKVIGSISMRDSTNLKTTGRYAVHL